MATLLASEKAELEGFTVGQLREIVREANRREAQRLFMSDRMREEADLARAALALRGKQD